MHLKNTNPWFFLLWNEKHRLQGKFHLKKWNDEQAIMRLYKNFSGKKPNLQNPKTFSEKQQWLKLNYYNPQQIICADKFEVREFIIEKGYKHILNDVLGIYQNIDDLDLKTLPNKFVLKATHGSGWNLICKDKNRINWFVWKKILNSWLKNNIFWPGREWPYKDMPARIICETYLEDDSFGLQDYKLFCFNGKVKFIQANKGRDTKDHAQNFYDLNWNILPFGKDLKPLPNVKIEKPKKLNEMIQIASSLSIDFPFVRVDFYEVKSKIIFGEMTFYPKSGLPDFVPVEYDKIIGDYLKLPN